MTNQICGSGLAGERVSRISEEYRKDQTGGETMKDIVRQELEEEIEPETVEERELADEKRWKHAEGSQI
jgi:hypothetical protein